MTNKLSAAPVDLLRYSFIDVVVSSVDQSLSEAVKKKIVINMTPPHVTCDFTFPLFQLSKELQLDYKKLAKNIVANIKKIDSHYIERADAVGGYVNIHVKSTLFYRDSFEYILQSSFFHEIFTTTKEKESLLFVHDPGLRQPHLYSFLSQFAKLSFNVIPCVLVNTFSSATSDLTHTLIEKLLKENIIEEIGNNVITLTMNDGKQVLFQRQNKTTTLLANNLALLNEYLKKHSPKIIVSTNESDQKAINELLVISRQTQLIPTEVPIIIMKPSQIFNEALLLNYKEILRRIETILENPINGQQAAKRSPVLAKMIAYTPEMFSHSIITMSPELLFKFLTEIGLYIGNHTSSSNESEQMLFQAAHKIFNSCINLISGSRQSLLK